MGARGTALRLRVQCTVVINGLHGSASPVRVSIRQFTDDGHFRRALSRGALPVASLFASLALARC